MPHQQKRFVLRERMLCHYGRGESFTILLPGDERLAGCRAEAGAPLYHPKQAFIFNAAQQQGRLHGHAAHPVRFHPFKRFPHRVYSNSVPLLQTADYHAAGKRAIYRVSRKMRFYRALCPCNAAFKRVRVRCAKAHHENGGAAVRFHFAPPLKVFPFVDKEN